MAPVSARRARLARFPRTNRRPIAGMNGVVHASNVRICPSIEYDTRHVSTPVGSTSYVTDARRTTPPLSSIVTARLSCQSVIRQSIRLSRPPNSRRATKVVPVVGAPGEVWRTSRTSFSQAGTFGKSMRRAQTSADGRSIPTDSVRVYTAAAYGAPVLTNSLTRSSGSERGPPIGPDEVAGTEIAGHARAGPLRSCLGTPDHGCSIHGRLSGSGGADRVGADDPAVGRLCGGLLERPRGTT